MEGGYARYVPRPCPEKRGSHDRVRCQGPAGVDDGIILPWYHRQLVFLLPVPVRRTVLPWCSLSHVLRARVGRPTIVAGLGYSGGQAQLHTGGYIWYLFRPGWNSADAGTVVPPYVPAVVFTVIVAVASDKLKMRGPFILLFLPITIAGEFSDACRKLRQLTATTGYILAIAATVGDVVAYEWLSGTISHSTFRTIPRDTLQVRAQSIVLS